MSNDKSAAKSSHLHEGHRHRLRERFRRSGLDDFAPHEVIELLLTYAIPRVDVNRQAHALVDRFGSVAGVLDALPHELTEVAGIGEEAATALSMLPPLFRRYELDKCSVKEPMDTIAKIGDFLHAKYTGITFEQVHLLLFDNSMRLIDCCHLADGAVNCARVTVRRIAELSLFNHAAGVVLAHNHPMGLAIPSGADIEVTQSVDNALETIGVPLLEHIVVTENSYAPIMRHHKGLLRASPMTGMVDKVFYEKFYGEI